VKDREFDRFIDPFTGWRPQRASRRRDRSSAAAAALRRLLLLLRARQARPQTSRGHCLPTSRSLSFRRLRSGGGEDRLVEQGRDVDGADTGGPSRPSGARPFFPAADGSPEVSEEEWADAAVFDRRVLDEALASAGLPPSAADGAANDLAPGPTEPPALLDEGERAPAPQEERSALGTARRERRVIEMCIIPDIEAALRRGTGEDAGPCRGSAGPHAPHIVPKRGRSGRDKDAVPLRLPAAKRGTGIDRVRASGVIDLTAGPDEPAPRRAPPMIAPVSSLIRSLALPRAVLGLALPMTLRRLAAVRPMERRAATIGGCNIAVNDDRPDLAALACAEDALSVGGTEECGLTQGELVMRLSIARRAASEVRAREATLSGRGRWARGGSPPPAPHPGGALARAAVAAPILPSVPRPRRRRIDVDSDTPEEGDDPAPAAFSGAPAAPQQKRTGPPAPVAENAVPTVAAAFPERINPLERFGLVGAVAQRRATGQLTTLPTGAGEVTMALSTEGSGREGGGASGANNMREGSRKFYLVGRGRWGGGAAEAALAASAVARVGAYFRDPTASTRGAGHAPSPHRSTDAQDAGEMASISLARRLQAEEDARGMSVASHRPRRQTSLIRCRSQEQLEQANVTGGAGEVSSMSNSHADGMADADAGAASGSDDPLIEFSSNSDDTGATGQRTSPERAIGRKQIHARVCHGPDLDANPDELDGSEYAGVDAEVDDGCEEAYATRCRAELFRRLRHPGQGWAFPAAEGTEAAPPPDVDEGETMGVENAGDHILADGSRNDAWPHLNVPGALWCALRPWQRAAVSWGWSLHRGRPAPPDAPGPQHPIPSPSVASPAGPASPDGTGGILADDMGLGKTLSALALLGSLHHSGHGLYRPSLVVCPATLLRHWAVEARRWSPLLRVVVLHPSFDAARAAGPGGRQDGAAQAAAGLPQPKAVAVGAQEGRRGGPRELSSAEIRQRRVAGRRDIMQRCLSDPMGSGLVLCSYALLRDEHQTRRSGAPSLGLLDVEWGWVVFDEAGILLIKQSSNHVFNSSTRALHQRGRGCR